MKGLRLAVPLWLMISLAVFASCSTDTGGTRSGSSTELIDQSDACDIALVESQGPAGTAPDLLSSNAQTAETTIEGVGGQRFFLRGDDVATIEVVSVADQTSEARQIDGGPVKLGHSVRPEG